MSFIAGKSRPAGPAAGTRPREAEAEERGARRAGLGLVALGLLMMLLSAAGSLAEGVRGLEEAASDETRFPGYLLVGADHGPWSGGEGELLVPDRGVPTGEDGVTVPESSR